MDEFLPVQLIELLSGDADHPAQTRCNGAALYADISGYTRLTERLAREGPDGIERLSAILDQSFARYIQVIAAHGGEIAYFAGDALLAWWPSISELSDAPTRLAIACACALTELDREATHADQPGLHVGVAAGALCAARVGGTERRWEVLLGGKSVREACHAMTLGGRGDVILAPSVRDRLEIGACTPLQSEGYARLARAGMRSEPTLFAPAPRTLNPTRARVADFLLEVLRDRGPEPSNRRHAELRPIACLCARIDGIDESQGDFLDRLQRAVSVLHDVARARAGATGRLVIDDKGLVFMLPLGIPLSSHSDDPARALRAGVEIAEQLRAIGLSCSAGVATGRAFCGVIGNELRRDYVVIGAPMNLAARLMQAADGCVLTSEKPAGLSDLAFDAVPTWHAKGLSAAINALRVTRAKRTAASRSPMRDRVIEKARLFAALGALAAGSGSVISLVADAGVGKSRLVEELMLEARARGLLVAQGACDAAGQSAPYLCWRGVLASIFGASADANAAEVARRARDYGHKSSQPELLPLLNDLLPLRLTDTGATAQLVGDHRALAVFRLFTTLLAECVAGPLLIVIEDCHWMDSASLRLLDFLARHARDVMVVLTTRPSAAARELQPLHEHPHFVELRLSALGHDDAIQLLADRLGGARVSDAVAQMVAAATDGNPLFIQEYCSLLRESGQISNAAGCWELAKRELAQQQVPVNVQRVIASRVDSLSPTEVQVLKIASVIGQTFSPGAVQKLCAEREIEASLASLERQELLISSGPAEAKTYAFRHALVRNAVYELMLYEQRRALHRAAASLMEREQDADTAASHVLLVHHWSLAGETDKTIHYANLAGAHALRLGAFREAVRFIEQCLQLAGPEPSARATELQILRWRKMLSEAHAGLGNHAVRSDEALRALTLAGCVTHVSQRHVRLELLVRLARHALWRDYGSRLRATPRTTSERALEIAWSYWHLAETAYFADDFPGLITHTARAMGHAGHAGPSPVLARAYTLLAGSLGLAGWERTARRYFARAATTAERAQDPHALAYSQMVACLYLVGIGDFEAVRESADKCQELCRALGDHVTWGNAQVVRFWMHHYRGELEPSRRTATELLARAERAGNLQHQTWALRRLALVELREEAPQTAIQHLEHSMQLFARSKDKNELIPTWSALALARMRAGAEREAIAALNTALHMSAGLGRPTAHGTLEGLSAQAEVIFSMLAREPKSRHWRRIAPMPLAALDRYQQVFRIGVPAYHLWRGVARALDAEPGPAMREWQKGHRAAQRLDMRFDERRLALKLAEATSTNI